MISTMINKDSVRKEFISYLNQDKKNKIKYCRYFWHYGAKQIQAIDTDYQYKSALDVYKQQGIELDRTEPISKEHLKMFGLKKGNMLFFHQKDDKNISDNHDPLAFAFDYMVGTSEFFMIEVELDTKKVKTNSNVKAFTQIETEVNIKPKNPNPYNLKEWIYTNGTVYAMNEKNAIKKATKLGYI